MCDPVQDKSFWFMGDKFQVVVILNDKVHMRREADGLEVQTYVNTFKKNAHPVEETKPVSSDVWFFIFMKRLEEGYYDASLKENRIQTIKDVRTMYSETNPKASGMPLKVARDLVEMARAWRMKVNKPESDLAEAREKLRTADHHLNILQSELLAARRAIGDSLQKI